MRSTLQPGQRIAPGGERSRTVLTRQPRQIVPVRRHPRQVAGVAAPGIERQQLLNQHRRRPAIHQNVMVGDHQPVLLPRKPDQRKPDQRRSRKIKAIGSVLAQKPRQPLLALRRIQLRKIKAAPDHLRPRHDHRHRTVELLVHEAGTQAGMALQQSTQRRLQRRHVQPAGQSQHQLHRVDVRSPPIIERMEQQTLLQRRQRQHVLDLRIAPLQTLDLALRQTAKRQIARAAPAGPGLLDMPHQRRQRPEPTLRQVPHRIFRKERRRKAPARRQPRSQTVIPGQRVDLQRVRQRHRRLAPAANRLRPGPDAVRRKPTRDS